MLLNDVLPGDAKESDAAFYDALVAICRQALDEDSFISELKRLLSQRWQTIKGSADSYCRARDLWLNQCCLAIALHLNPQHPQVILMPDLCGLEDTYFNRFDQLSWYDFITTGQDDFFIHLTDFFETAWVQIMQADPKALQYVDKGHQQVDLSAYEQAMIEHVLPQAHLIFDYVKNPTTDKSTLLDKLQALRAGLLAGDVTHGGQEYKAGDKAHEAIAEFYEFYESLKERQVVLRGLKAKNSNFTLGYYLDCLFKPLNRARNQGAIYCVEIIGREIEAIINDNVEKLREEAACPEFYQLKKTYLAIKSTLTSPLCLAINSNDVATFQALINKLTTVEYNNPLPNQQETLLTLCALKGRASFIKLLMQLPQIKVNQTRSDSATPLHVAAQNGHVDCVQTLLDHGANINQANLNGATPLYAATFNGHVDCVQTLLDHGANINQANLNGVTPLYAAAQNGHVECVKALLKHGVNLNQTRCNGATPLYIAAKNGHTACVQVLLEHKDNVNQNHDNGFTPLYIAAQNGHADCVQALLEHGVNADELCPNDAPPIHVAARNGHVACVHALLKYGAKVNQTHHNFQSTPLYLATQYGHADCVKALLDHGANVDEPCYGFTPLHSAAINGHADCVRTLLEYGANVNQERYIIFTINATPLSLAAKNNHLATYVALLKAPYFSKHPDALKNYFNTTNSFGTHKLTERAKKQFIAIALQHYTKPHLEQLPNTLDAYIACFQQLTTQKNWFTCHTAFYAEILKTLKGSILDELGKNPNFLTDERNRQAIQNIMDYQRNWVPNLFGTASSRKLNQIILEVMPSMAK